MTSEDAIKQRLICLRGPHQTEDQAPAAAKVLSDVTGVFKAEAISTNRVRLTYSLEYLTFDLIADLLQELGFHLDNSVISKIRRALFQYVETTALERLQESTQSQPHPSVAKKPAPSSSTRKETASGEYWQKYW